jgi:DNA repair protein RadC
MFSKEFYKFLNKFFKNRTEERLMIFYVNFSRGVFGYDIIASGGKVAASVYLDDVVNKAVINSAQNIIVTHNHPNGDKRFSKGDIELTKAISEALEVHKIVLLNHVLYTDGGCESLFDDKTMEDLGRRK